MKLFFQLRFNLYQHWMQWVLNVLHKQSPTECPGISPLKKQFHFYMLGHCRQLESEMPIENSKLYSMNIDVLQSTRCVKF